MLFALSPAAFSYSQPIIFFPGGHSDQLDPAQWSIGPEARAVLHRVVEEFRAYKPRYLLIIGHDENASTPEMSRARSQKRADAARDVLIELGLPADALATKACGFSRPLQSPVGIEPMNRRVEFAGAEALQDLLEMDREICQGAYSRRP